MIRYFSVNRYSELQLKNHTAPNPATERLVEID